MVTYTSEQNGPLEFETALDPEESRAYDFDFTNDLASGETISSTTITADSGITVSGDTLDGTSKIVQVTLTGGTAGVDYHVACKVTTSAPQTIKRTGIVKCRTM